MGQRVDTPQDRGSLFPSRRSARIREGPLGFQVGVRAALFGDRHAAIRSRKEAVSE